MRTQKQKFGTMKRRAANGNCYTYQEFIDYYGPDALNFWSIATNNCNGMNKREVKILIACHPRQFLNRRSDHWQSDIIISESNINFPDSNIIYETLDITGTGTYQTDIFDSRWVRDNTNYFNAIWLPDCGGQWYYMFITLELGDIDTFSYDLERILTKLLKQLKPGGILYLGKILMDDKELFAHLILSLELQGLIPKIERIDIRKFAHDLDYVIIQKKI